MAASFTLSWTGQAEASAESLGISVEARVLNNQRADEVTLVLQAGAGDDEQVTPRDFVTIKKDGVKWFVGLAASPIYQASANVNRQIVKLRGPWHILENVAWGHTPPSSPSYTPLPPRASTTWANIADWTNTYLSDVLTVPGSWSAPLDELILPYLTLRANSLAANMRALLGWFPNYATRFDYSGTLPALEVVKRGQSEVAFDYGEPPLAELSLADLSSEEPLAVRLRYKSTSGFDTLTTEEQAELGAYVITTSPSTDPNVWPSDSTAREWEKLTLCLFATELDALLLHDGTSGPQVADYLLTELLTLRFRGSLKFRDDGNCSTGIQPGDSLNISGLHSRFESAQLLVQSVTEVFRTGETMVEVGLPSGIDVSNLFALLRTRLKWIRGLSRPLLPYI